MKLSQAKIRSAVRVLRSFGAYRILLFGSMAEDPDRAQDIDLAVEGIPLGRILDADVAVHDILQTPTDLISREENPAMFEIARDYGRVLYEERQAEAGSRT